MASLSLVVCKRHNIVTYVMQCQPNKAWSVIASSWLVGKYMYVHLFKVSNECGQGPTVLQETLVQCL